MSAHPMMSNALHAGHQRRRIESARDDSAICSKVIQFDAKLFFTRIVKLLIDYEGVKNYASTL